MIYTKEQIDKLMINENYTLSLKYDSDWIIENSMGAHCLWLQESMLQVMHIKSDMRVLDIGCGKAISSIFLAREVECQVWATDLWINASDNWKRILEMGVGDNNSPCTKFLVHFLYLRHSLGGESE